ncbi:MAG: DNA replication and repair protein RecF [Melioribacteraceae bacterium]
MVLEFIELKNFRLHSKTSLELSKNINYIIGGNGQGKTTILEAIYYLCTTKSMNQVSDSEAVKFNEDYFEVAGRFTELSNNKVRVFYEKNSNKKTVQLNDKPVHRASSIIGKFPVVALVQSDHAITQGSPAERRRFVDSIISQSSATYLKLLLDYNRILRQRSALLSKLKEFNSTELHNQLEVWTHSLVKTGSEVVRHRIDFIKDFNEYILKPYAKILGGKENPSIKYVPFDEVENKSIDEIFTEKLNQKKTDELRSARNLIGPHRDDFEFSIDDLSLRKFGSQGQHKTFQIALRFSQFYYLQDKLQVTPIFLMDDIFGELDSSRAEKISSYLSEVGQAFITMTDFSNINKLSKTENDIVFNVNNGVVANA